MARLTEEESEQRHEDRVKAAQKIQDPKKRAKEISNSQKARRDRNLYRITMDKRKAEEDAMEPTERKPSTRPRTETQKKRDGENSKSASANNMRGATAPSKPEPTGPIRFIQENIKDSDFKTPGNPQLGAPIDMSVPDMDFFQPDVITNSSDKALRYLNAVADPRFPHSQFYRATEVAPFGPGLSLMDRSQSTLIDAKSLRVTAPKGWVSAKGNCCVREGVFFYEAKCVFGPPNKNPNAGPGYNLSLPNITVGFGRREANLEVPAGHTLYSYGIRAKGFSVHNGKTSKFFEGFEQGDIIGLEISLPPLDLHRKIVDGTYNPAVDAATDYMAGSAVAADIVRDRFARHIKGKLVMEVIDYALDEDVRKTREDQNNVLSNAERGEFTIPPSATHPLPTLRTLPDSYIKVYKNGRDIGVAFKDLIAFLPPASLPDPKITSQPNANARVGKDDGMLGYFPMVSAFAGGIAELNFGPDFAYPPPGYVKTNKVEATSKTPETRLHAISERYNEQIAEDVLWDIVDEVDFMMQGDTALGGAPALTRRNELNPSHEQL